MYASDTSYEEHKKGLILTAPATDASSKPSLDKSFWNSWYPEITALCFSTLSAIAITGTLIAFDGRQTPKSRYGVNLNAIVSILATASKAALIYAVSNCIGQLKWTWLDGQNMKSLMDAEIFDAASRGPYGAICMLVRSTRQSLASIGAIIVILALTFYPFVQQVITYEASIQYAESTDATIMSAHSYNIDDTQTPFRKAAQ